MNNIFKFFIALLLFVFAYNANASVISVGLHKNSIQVGGLSYVDIKLDTQNQSINTFEGDVVYDQSFLQIEQINTGNSFASFWVEKPTDKNTGIVHFSGVVPGGIVTAEGNLFSIVFRGQKEGGTNITITNPNLFINDGEGSNDMVKINSVKVDITKNTDGSFEELSINDTNLPEKFKILRTKDPAIFDDQWFIAFSTQDKGAGISKYKVCEYFKKYCVGSESPHLLKNQTPFYYIVVSAYDAQGNTRESKLISPWIIFGIIILILVLIISIVYSYRRYFRKYKV